MVGTHPGAEDVQGSFAVSHKTQSFVNGDGIDLRPYRLYFLTVRATNYAGLRVERSVRFRVDNSPPIAGSVSDGLGGVDVDWIKPDDRLSASWSGFADTQSGIRSYSWAVLVGDTCASEDDTRTSHWQNTATLMDFVDAGTASNASIKDIDLAPGKRAFVAVRAYNFAGLYAEAFSDGVAADNAVPCMSIARDVRADSTDTTFHASLDDVRVSWGALLDPANMNATVAACSPGAAPRDGPAAHVVPSAPITSFSYRFVSPSNWSGLNTTGVWGGNETHQDAFVNATSKARLDPKFRQIGARKLASPFGACCSNFSEHAPTQLHEDRRIVTSEEHRVPHFGCSLAAMDHSTLGTVLAVAGESSVVVVRLAELGAASEISVGGQHSSNSTDAKRHLSSAHNHGRCVPVDIVDGTVIYVASRALHMDKIGSAVLKQRLDLPGHLRQFGQHMAVSRNVHAVSATDNGDGEHVVVLDRLDTKSRGWRTSILRAVGRIGSLGVSTAYPVVTVGMPGVARVDMYVGSHSVGFTGQPAVMSAQPPPATTGGFGVAQQFERGLLAVGQLTSTCDAHVHVYRYDPAQQKLETVCRQHLQHGMRQCNSTMSISSTQQGSDTLFAAGAGAMLHVVKVSAQGHCRIVSRGAKTPLTSWHAVAMTQSVVAHTRVDEQRNLTWVSYARFCSRDHYRARDGAGWQCKRCPAGQLSGGGISQVCSSCGDRKCAALSDRSFTARLNASMLLHGEHYQVEIQADSGAHQNAAVRSPGFTLDLTPPVVGAVLDGRAVVKSTGNGSSPMQRHNSSVLSAPATDEGKAASLCLDNFGLQYCTCAVKARGQRTAPQAREVEGGAGSLEEYTQTGGRRSGALDECAERRSAEATRNMCEASDTFTRNCRRTCGNCTSAEMAQNVTQIEIESRTEVVCTDCDDIAAQPNTTELGCRWSGFFDEESDITRHFVGFGTEPGVPNVVPLVDVGRSLDFAAYNLSLQHAATYYCIVHAENGAGRRSVASSNGVKVDTSPPVMLYVNDGIQAGVDVDTQTFEDAVFGNWKAQDNESAIVDYEWAIGTSPGATNVMDFESVTTAERFARFELELPEFALLYVTARATNAAGRRSLEMTSDGIRIGKGEVMLEPEEETVVMFDTVKVGAASDKAEVGVNTSRTTNRATEVPEDIKAGRPVLGALVSPPGAVGNATRLVAGALSDEELTSGKQQDPGGNGEALADPADSTTAAGEARAPPRNFRYGNYSFAIRAYDENKQPRRSFRFAKPVVMSIFFDVKRLLAKSEGLSDDGRKLQTPSLMLFSEVHNKWMQARDTCDPPTWTVNYNTSMYTVHVCHLTQFALFFQSKPVASIAGCARRNKLVYLPPGKHLQLDASGSYDVDGRIEQYNWTRVAGPSVPASGSDAPLAFARPQHPTTAVSNVAEGTHTFTVAVADNDLASDEASCEVQVIAAEAVHTFACGDETSRTLAARPLAHVRVASARWHRYSHGSDHGAADLADWNATATDLTGGIDGRNYSFVLAVTTPSGLVIETYYTVQAAAPGAVPQCPAPPGLSAATIAAAALGAVAAAAAVALAYRRREQRKRKGGLDVIDVDLSSSRVRGWTVFDDTQDKASAAMKVAVDNPLHHTATLQKKTHQVHRSKGELHTVDEEAGAAEEPEAPKVRGWSVFDDKAQKVEDYENPLTVSQQRFAKAKAERKAAMARSVLSQEKEKNKKKIRTQYLQRTLSGRTKRGGQQQHDRQGDEQSDDSARAGGSSERGSEHGSEHGSERGGPQKARAHFLRKALSGRSGRKQRGEQMGGPPAVASSASDSDSDRRMTRTLSAPEDRKPEQAQL
eukprot:g4381.t1